MEHELLSKGIYAIINKKLGLVYVGETQRNFLIRWIEHLIRIPNHVKNLDRIKLFLHEDTKFLILKKLDETEYVSKDFYRFEQEAYEFYKKKGWGIVSTHYFNESANNKFYTIDEEKIIERYKKAINHMVLILSTVNTKHKNGSFILANLYNQINKKFNTDVKSRDGKSVLSSLTQEELEYMMLELYPRFYYKKIHVLKEEIKQLDTQMSLF